MEPSSPFRPVYCLFMNGPGCRMERTISVDNRLGNEFKGALLGCYRLEIRKSEKKPLAQSTMVAPVAVSQ
jgi:hypothetical protein